MKVFISYRWKDSAGFARALADRLAERLGKSEVFHDVETVGGGDDFRQVAHAAIDSADVVLVVIGPDWLSATDSGARRLDNATDLVRQEVARALRSSARVIPVLVEAATMPRREDLPAEIADLADRNAVEVSNSRFDGDVDRLVRQIARGKAGRQVAWWAVGLAVAGAVTGGQLAWARPTSLFLPGLVALSVLGAAAVAGLLRAVSLRRGAAPNRLLTVAAPLGWIAAVAGAGWLANPRGPGDTFTLAVRVSGPNGPTATITQGTITIDLGTDRRRAEIGSNSQAIFLGVPARFRSAPVNVVAQVEGYQVLRSEAITVGGDGVVDLVLTKARYATEVRGTVVSPSGVPVPGVSLDFDNGRAVAISDSLGTFRVKLPVPPGTVVPVRATRGGVTGYHDQITVPESSALTIVLTREVHRAKRARSN